MEKRQKDLPFLYPQAFLWAWPNSAELEMLPSPFQFSHCPGSQEQGNRWKTFCSRFPSFFDLYLFPRDSSCLKNLFTPRFPLLHRILNKRMCIAPGIGTFWEIQHGMLISLRVRYFIRLCLVPACFPNRGPNEVFQKIPLGTTQYSSAYFTRLWTHLPCQIRGFQTRKWHQIEPVKQGQSIMSWLLMAMTRSVIPH